MEKAKKIIEKRWKKTKRQKNTEKDREDKVRLRQKKKYND